MMQPQLPISDALPDIVTHLEHQSNLALVAPPGAGKTTLVPLALLDATWRSGQKIIVLEPRRIAARAAAARMADLLGEKVGARVGYRVRFDSKASQATMIEVVTEGIFSRMLADNPGLEGVAAVLFDEFHERSLEGDLALALCLDLQSGLREDLRLVAMSATLDGAAVAGLLKTSVIESRGRSFPVEIIHREHSSDVPIEKAVTAAVVDELAANQDGSILVFLPGRREIERLAESLATRLPAGAVLHKLYGALQPAEQDAALQPATAGQRKVVLASAIAETSLTIDGITTVVDTGLSRQPVFEPATGLTRLQTVRASQASVTQRAGRAGRLVPGRAVRLWRAAQTAALPAQTTPEILNADLTGLVLDLADWGVHEVNSLRWLDVPPESAVNEARALLREFGALDADGALTRHGKSMHAVALPPRMAHMVVVAAEYGLASARRAALLALLVQERGAGSTSNDLAERCDNTIRNKDSRSRKLVQHANRLAERAGGEKPGEPLDHGVLLGFGFPDRIAQATGTGRFGAQRYRLANGRGAEVDGDSVLAREPWLVVVDMAGRAGAARVLSAAAVSKADIEEYFADRIEQKVDTEFDAGTGAVSATRSLRLGAIVLGKPQPAKLDASNAQTLLMQAVREHGVSILPWRETEILLRNRLSFLHHNQPDRWPQVDDDNLLQRLDEWFAPFLAGCTSLAALKPGALGDGLLLLAGHPSKVELERLAPSFYEAPSGSRLPVGYRDDMARLSVRPQELFGLTVHPCVLDGTVAMEIELLSPAGRPIQLTRDLPGFWSGSWSDVRSDLRGRYPKHPWPEDPAHAEPTHRTKRRH